jgi:hypothetical protein
VRTRANNPWVSQSTAIAVALPYSPALEVISMRERLAILRDTLIVLSMQLAFRTAQLLRHLNY